MGRHIVLHGDPSDPYFQNAEAILAAEAPLEAWVKANVRPDGVVIDAGGNIGLTALLLSALVHDGHVHVFEALPRNAEYLRRNIEENGIRNCTVNAVALGRRPGNVRMSANGPGSHVLPSDADGTDVPMTTLDRYVADAGLTRLDFVKIDVEGYEPAVLDGAAATIERFRPPVFMEFNTWCLSYMQDQDAMAFAQLLWSAFDMRSIDASGAERPAAADPYGFFHNNAVLHGMNEDVLLRLRPDARVPGLGGLERGVCGLGTRLELERAQVELKQVRVELDAMRQSISWRVTTPLRRMRQLLQQRRPRASLWKQGSRK